MSTKKMNEKNNNNIRKWDGDEEGGEKKKTKHQKQINKNNKLDEMWLKSENGNSRHTDNNELVCLVDWWKSQMSRKMPFIVY